MKYITIAHRTNINKKFKIFDENKGSVSKFGGNFKWVYLCLMLSDHELLKLLLPEFLVEHFDILK
ncbi:hypothetical protein, partial [Chryseobacterium sp.]|uniref:hypothetical protein n=1 Tax=Chryseobacterium sp. TaxID=1871047 RepID=UPI0031D0E5C5